MSLSPRHHRLFLQHDRPGALLQSKLLLLSQSTYYRTTCAIAKMASGLFFDPLKLLRLAPLVTTTSSLTFAWDEHWYLSGFLRPEHRQHSEAMLPSYFRRFFEQGIYIIAGLNMLTIGTSIANLLLIDRDAPSHAPSGKCFYWAGLSFTIAHFIFAPLVAYPIRDIIEDRSQGKSTGILKRWLEIHHIRVLVVNLPGWASFLAAVLTTFHL